MFTALFQTVSTCFRWCRD